MLLERQRRGAQRRPSQKAQTLVLRALLVVLIVLPLHTALGLTNGLALTPPMGWNSWNKYHCNINETIIRSIADAFVTSGLQAAGYQFVNIDDCWQVSRDTNGVIVADSGKFPSASAPSLPIPQAAFSCCNYRRTKVLWCLHPVCGRLILSKLTSSQYEPAMPGSFWN